MDWLVFFIVVIAVVILFVLIRLKKMIGLVKENSVRYKKLVKLNNTYKFHTNVKKSIDVVHFVKSKTELSKLSLNELIVDLFSDNVNNTFLNTKYVMDNENKYELYLKKYNAIDDVTGSEIIAVTNIKLKTFNYLEKELFKKGKLKPLTKTKVSLTAKFDTPKGENKYQKSENFKYDEVKNIFNKVREADEGEE